MEEYQIHGNPQNVLPNIGNPYVEQDTSSSRGEPYITFLNGQSTMVSENIEMVKRLHNFLPWASVKRGNQPTNDLGYEKSPEEINKGSNYKSKYTN